MNMQSYSICQSHASGCRKALMACLLLILLAAAACDTKSTSPQARAPGAVSPSARVQSAASQQQEPQTNAPAAEPSVFQAEGPATGPDPFFPQIDRSAGVTAIDSAPIHLSSHLKLVGIWPGEKRPLALINKTSFSPGQAGEVAILLTNQNQTTLHKIQIRCLEIRRDSVLISISGEPETKELRLAQND
jgi:hypothetical protein